MLYVLLDATRAWLDEVGLYRFVRVLDQIEFRVLACAVLAFLIVLLAGPGTIRLLRRLKIGDSGLSDSAAIREQMQSKVNTPTMGGVLIVGAVLASTLLLADVRVYWVYVGLLVMVWLAGVGGADDWLKLTAARRGQGRQGLYAWEKLVFQIGLGVLVGWFVYGHGQAQQHAFVDVVNLPMQRTYAEGPGMEAAAGLIHLPRWAFVLLSVLLIAGMSNAVNITDGMDGLAGGLSVIVALGMIVLALVAGSSQAARYLLVPHVPGASEIGVMCGAAAGACLGFLWWNCSPAKVFMGDTGSLSLGGLIAYVAIALRQEFVILLMSGIFLWEILSVVIQVGYFRATGGKRVFRCAPYHHHLHITGWTEQQVVVRAWICGLLLVVVALASVKVR